MSILAASNQWTGSVRGVPIKDLRIVPLQSIKELKRVISMLENDEDFKNIPYEEVPPFIIIPISAVLLLKTKGIEFHSLKAKTRDKLTTKEQEEIRHKRAGTIPLGEAIFFIRLKFLKNLCKKWIKEGGIS